MYHTTLNYVKSDSRMCDFSDSTLINRDGKDYILTVCKERKKLGRGDGEVINADDPENRDLIRRMISE